MMYYRFLYYIHGYQRIPGQWHHLSFKRNSLLLLSFSSCRRCEKPETELVFHTLLGQGDKKGFIVKKETLRSHSFTEISQTTSCDSWLWRQILFVKKYSVFPGNSGKDTLWPFDTFTTDQQYIHVK